MRQWSDGMIGVMRYLTYPRSGGSEAHRKAMRCSICPNLEIRTANDFKGAEGFVMKTMYGAPLYATCGLCGCPVMAEPDEWAGTVNFTVKGQAFSLIPRGKTEVDVPCDAGNF